MNRNVFIMFKLYILIEFEKLNHSIEWGNVPFGCNKYKF